MGAGLYDTEPVFRDAFDRCAMVLLTEHDIDIRAAVFAPGGDTGADARLHAPQLALPAIFTVEYALAQQWAAWGIRPDAMIGHSLGEYTAAALSGVLSLDDALALVALRGALFERATPGAMLRSAFRRHSDAARQRRRSPQSTAKRASSPGRWPTSHDSKIVCARTVSTAAGSGAAAGHSVLVEPLLDEFARTRRHGASRTPSPWVSNLSGTWITSAGQRVGILPGTSVTVRFPTGWPNCWPSRTILLEVGPGRTLARWHSRTRREPPVMRSTPRCATAKSRAYAVTLLGAAGGLWIAGAPLAPQAFAGTGTHRIVSLPGYPFEKQRHWIEPEGRLEPPRALELQRVVGEVMSANGAVHQALPRVKAIVSAVSGIPADAIAESQTFFDLGLDSLGLIQVNAALKKQLGVQLSLAQLLDQFAQIGALAAHIDGLGATITAPAVATPAAPAAPTAIPAASGLDGVIAQQLEIMRMQLELVRSAERRRPVARPIPAPYPPAATREPAKSLSRSRGRRGHGPALSRPGTAPRRADRRYTKRTHARRICRRYRDVLADSRAAVGFRLAVRRCSTRRRARAAGSRFWDLDDNAYIDLINGFGVRCSVTIPRTWKRARRVRRPGDLLTAFAAGGRGCRASRTHRDGPRFVYQLRTEAVMAAIAWPARGPAARSSSPSRAPITGTRTNARAIDVA